VAVEVLGREDVDGERVGLVGVSIGGTLALLAAQDPRLDGRLAVVTAISPLTDLREALRLATTRHHRLGDRLVRYEVDPFVMEVIERSFPALGSPGRPQAVDELLANNDPERFDELYEALPPALRGPLERLSPMRQAGELDVRVEAATGPHDDYFPPDQVERLAERAPDARLTLTRVLDHADLSLGGGGPMDALRFNRVVVRSLVEARS
jgi:pimeloyl-ACP methyl ester carboxylesterase